MEWLRQNGFFLILLIIFIGIHLFGRGGQGGHEREEDEEQRGHSEHEGGNR